MANKDRKRAGMFDDMEDSSGNSEATPNSGLDFKRFTPKPAPTIDPKAVAKIGEEAGFRTTHSKAPKTSESGKPKVDGRTLKKSPRTIQFNIRLRPETADRFWRGAADAEHEYADHFLSQLLDVYENGSP